MCKSITKQEVSEGFVLPVFSQTLERPPIVFFVADEDVYANRKYQPVIDASGLPNHPSLAGTAAVLEKLRSIFGPTIWKVQIHPDDLTQLDPALRACLQAGSSSTDTRKRGTHNKQAPKEISAKGTPRADEKIQETTT